MNDGPRALHSVKWYSESAKQVAAPEIVEFTARLTRSVRGPDSARQGTPRRGPPCAAWRVVRMISGTAEKVFWGPSIYDSMKSLAIPYSNGDLHISVISEPHQRATERHQRAEPSTAAGAGAARRRQVQNLSSNWQLTFA